MCGNLKEFDGKKCLYSTSFRFHKHFDISEKKIGCPAHQKIFLPHLHYYVQTRFRSTKQNDFQRQRNFFY